MKLEALKSGVLVAAAGAISVLLAAEANAAVFAVAAVPTYDAATNANVVDSTAPSSTALSTFTSDVAAAYAANLGGVLNFEGIATGNSSQVLAAGDRIDVTYGTGNAKVLQLTFNNGGQLSATASSTPISGSYGLTSFYGRTLTIANPIDAVTGLPTGEVVTQVALTALSRSPSGSEQTATLTATYSGGGTQSLSDVIALTQAGDDTFFAFTAPAGQSIVSLSAALSATSPRVEAFDDLGFITSTTAVPEPTSLGLLGLCGGTLLARRLSRHGR
jgi:hypothetical protein